MFKELASLFARKQLLPHRDGWYPPALRHWNLVLAAFLCWTFIALLQYYLHRSQIDGGIIFALNVNGLPLQQSFVYLYLPTIIAVIFSVFIVWIDNDAKRYEPYRQMSSPDGAAGKDSLLLQYPFDFMPLVPLVAAKRRHGTVFWASFATVLTTFGVVPLQAGIFSVRQSSQSLPQNFTIAEGFNQTLVVEASRWVNYTHSVYGIVTLNQTLPAFMARNFTLKPFALSGDGTNQPGTLTARTTMYDMVLHCDKGTIETEAAYCSTNPLGQSYPCSEVNMTERTVTGSRSSAGCLVGADVLNPRVIGDKSGGNSSSRNKRFSASYWGHYDTRVDEYTPNDRLQFMCDNTYRDGNKPYNEETKGTFFASFAENRATTNDSPTAVAAIFCKLSYHEQDVEATVDAVSKAPLNIVPLGLQRQLSSLSYSFERFEQNLAAGMALTFTRPDSLPLETIPRYMELLSHNDLTPVMMISDMPRPGAMNPGDLAAMLSLVMTMATDRLQDLVDADALAEAYQRAYQILFARAMADVLTWDYAISTTNVMGTRTHHLEAVTLEPIFTYLVEGLLGVVSLAVLSLLFLSFRDRTRCKLADDPDSIAATMSITADDKILLSTFKDLDCATTPFSRQSIRHDRYHLRLSNSSVRVCHMDLRSSARGLPTLPQSESDANEDSQLAHPKRAKEFRAMIALPLTGVFVALAIALGVPFAKSQPHGLAMPSNNRITQTLVTDYLPTAIATLIEPMWVLINRLLCALQPFEQMRGSRAEAARSISLRYSTLPPQLTILKAIRARHIILAVVGTMALLANLLATTFAGLFYRQVLSLSELTLFEPVMQARFVYVNGSIGPPWNSRLERCDMNNYKHQLDTLKDWDSGDEGLLFSGAYQGGTGETQFLVAESNYTSNTSLPAWTDNKALYIPFRRSGQGATSTQYQARTRFFTAEPNCAPLKFREDYDLDIYNGYLAMMSEFFTVDIADSSGWEEYCGAMDFRFFGDVGDRRSSIVGPAQQRCRDGIVAVELSTPLKKGPICGAAFVLGWVRVTQPSCDLPRPFDHEEQHENNTFLIKCQPRMKTGTALVTVDTNGNLLKPAEEFTPDVGLTDEELAQYFTNGPKDVIAQSNLYLARSANSVWHNETAAGEYLPYFMNRARGDHRLTDPHAPLPTFADIEEPLNQAYARLFAIWLGLNMENLFLSANESTPKVQGIETRLEERLLFVTPLFIISEVILGLYIVVSILVYLRRPGRYLPWLPTSIASIIALFASSSAVEDLQNTAHMTNKECDAYLNDLGHRYGYGSYIGSDGAVHVGIEKVPYVRYMKEVTFAGSRVDMEMRRRQVKNAGSTSGCGTTSADDTNVALDLSGAERTSVSHSVVNDQPPRADYMPVGRLDFTDDVSVLSSVSRSSVMSRSQGRRPKEEQATLLSDSQGIERCVSPLEEVMPNGLDGAAEEFLDDVQGRV